jgi:hypothetical protein
LAHVIPALPAAAANGAISPPPSAAAIISVRGLRHPRNHRACFVMLNPSLDHRSVQDRNGFVAGLSHRRMMVFTRNFQVIRMTWLTQRGGASGAGRSLAMRCSTKIVLDHPLPRPHKEFREFQATDVNQVS